MTEPSGPQFPSARQLLAPTHWPSWLPVGLLWLLVWLPTGFRNALGHGLGRLLYRVWGKRLRILYTNLDLCFPNQSREQHEAMARQHVQILVRTLLDYGLLCFASPARIRRRVRFHGMAHVDAAIEAGRGVLMMPIHSCALDYGICAIGIDHDALGPYKPMRNPVADWLLRRARTRFRGEPLPRDAGLRPVLRGLKSGRIVMFLADEDLGRDAAVFAPLFNVPKATLTTPARLAGLGNADVLLATTLFNPSDGGYDCHILPPLADFPSGHGRTDAARLNACVEQLVMMDPAQYMWTLRLFRTLPDGQKRRYR